MGGGRGACAVVGLPVAARDPDVVEWVLVCLWLPSAAAVLSAAPSGSFPCLSAAAGAQLCFCVIHVTSVCGVTSPLEAFRSAVASLP